MHKRTKLWSSLSLAALVGSGTLSACSPQEPEGAAAEDSSRVEEAVNPMEDTPVAKTRSVAVVPAGGEAEGEGLSAEVDPATDDVAYLTQLGLMRGHLLVGLELYRAGHIDHARTHSKHPKSELYADLVPAFQAREAAGFADQLEALAKAMESDDSALEQVEAAYADVLAGIAEAENRAGDIEAGTQLQVVVNLVRTAAEEYAIGVVDGDVVNGHEYQDAFGFTRTAQARVDGIDSAGDEELASGLESVNGYLQALFDAGTWPDVMPPERLDTDASELYGAAARIEIVALGLE